jgi:alpha-beta hydrolase superfamily lysophospholipase
VIEAREQFELEIDRGVPIRGEVLGPPETTGAVVLCHGFKGFARWGFFPYLAEQIAAAGLRTISFNFSGSGVGPDGESFTEAEAFFHNTFSRERADLALVEREALHRGWIGERYGLFGHSRGGGIAVLHAARTERVAALVTWSAIAHPMRWAPKSVTLWREQGYIDVPNVRTGQILRLGTAALDDVERGQNDALNIRAAASRVRVPWLIVHGTMDETVPYADAEQLRLAAGDGAQLLPVEGANHTFDIRHPMTAPSPALERVTRETVELFRQCVAGMREQKAGYRD